MSVTGLPAASPKREARIFRVGFFMRTQSCGAETPNGTKSHGSLMNIDCCRDQRNARADTEQRCPQENLNQAEVPLGNCLRDGDGFCPFHYWPLLSPDTCKIHA